MNELKQKWAAEAAAKLKGKTITGVRYMTAAECESMDWSNAAIVLDLSDGNSLFPSSDDEGNDAGALFTTYKDLEIIPVI